VYGARSTSHHHDETVSGSHKMMFCASCGDTFNGAAARRCWRPPNWNKMRVDTSHEPAARTAPPTVRRTATSLLDRSSRPITIPRQMNAIYATIG
jgi:hypothetical protein